MHNNFQDKQGDRYLTLDLDLDSIGSPDKYRIIFYAEQKNLPSDWKIHFTNWNHIPRPVFNISIFPNIVELRQGENKTVDIQLQSSTGFNPTINILLHNESQIATNTYLQVNSKDITIPPYGLISVPMTIIALDNATVGHHTTRLSGYADFPITSYYDVNNSLPASLTEAIAAISKNEEILEQSDLSVVIQPKLGFIDTAINELNKWQFPITFISGIVLGNIGPWIYKKAKSRLENKEKKKFSTEWE